MPKELPVDRKCLLKLLYPLVQELDEKHKQWRKNCFDETLTNEVEQLKKQVKDKWNARLHWPESTIQGVTDFYMLVREPFKAVVDARGGGTMILPLQEDGLNLGEMTFASFEGNGLIHCPPHKIPIIIDPNILTLHDAQTVKDEVWEIVKAEIGKRKNTIKGDGREPVRCAPVVVAPVGARGRGSPRVAPPLLDGLHYHGAARRCGGAREAPGWPGLGTAGLKVAVGGAGAALGGAPGSGRQEARAKRGPGVGRSHHGRAHTASAWPLDRP